AAAMGVHGVVRATEDVDIFVRATPDNLTRLRKALRAAYAADPNVDDIKDEDLLGDYPAVRYFPPSGDLYLDIMTRLGEAASYETVEREIKEVAGIRIVVATPRALVRLKRDTVRAIDRQDGGRVQRFRSAEEMGHAPARIGSPTEN